MVLRKLMRIPVILGSAGCLTFALAAWAQISGSEGINTTVAAGGVGGGVSATDAELYRPVAVDGSGNLYISDSGNNRIRTVAFPQPIPFSINDRGGLSITSSGGSGSVIVGYARVGPTVLTTAPIRSFLEPTPAGVTIFSFRQNGVLISEASVPAAPLIQGGRIYAEVVGAVNTGLAIANPNDVAATINFFLPTASGQYLAATAFHWAPTTRWQRSWIKTLSTPEDGCRARSPLRRRSQSL